MDVVVADVSDEASLEAMCARTTVLLNCVGPVGIEHTLVFLPGGCVVYGARARVCVCSVCVVCVCVCVCSTASVKVLIFSQFQLYGEAVVKACINKKCNYVDITGETYVS